ncbi:MAG: hypothetical protein PUP91_01690 [Rhizonema sp. PD37]|nr:hypothetical protein [Rhizonema sp. PD37]
MGTPNFAQMTSTELREYLKKHPNDKQAFHARMDKIYANPNSTWYASQDIAGEEELRKAIEKERQCDDSTY